MVARFRCTEFLHTDQAEPASSFDSPLLLPTIITPSRIKEHLDKYVVGQEHAKRTLSVALYNRTLRIMDSCLNTSEVAMEKSNIMMIGPTGSGKTFLIHKISELLNTALIIADATSFTETGYIGRDLREIFVGLVNKAYIVALKTGTVTGAAELTTKTKEIAEHGIVYIDEIDKIASGPNSNRRFEDSLQQELLKMVEGDTVVFDDLLSNNKARLDNPTGITSLDTKNILFIIGGSFPGLEKHIGDRINPSSVGFKGDINTKETIDSRRVLKEVRPEDLIKYGFSDEFVGRFFIRTVLDRLTKRDLVNILTKPKNSFIKQYKKLFGLSNRELIFTKQALNKVAELAIKNTTGARALRNILEKTLENHQFDAPDQPFGPAIRITSRLVRE